MSRRAFQVVVALTGLLFACQNRTTCQLHSRYRQNTDDVGEAELSFSPNGPGHFIVRQTDVKNFMGTATFSEGVLRVIFQTANGYAGTYTWELDPTCMTGKGRLDFEKGGTGTHRSTLTTLE
jgi:hypothetical protein